MDINEENMDLSKATDDELIDECRKRKLSYLTPTLYKLWINPQDKCWDDIE